eukprot:TRINITY_DN13734_c0_g1_i1.p1 TRINITY_DN13734_c0_g1~~TRINITY_DN13734_c0_g1_i1.p1  ORF type:complete len:245 (+),score=66.95 TRINITY_DN13734_c0_g1_i1:71-736(+)
MGNCSSNNSSNVSPSPSPKSSKVVDVCKPSETPDHMFEGGVPLKKTYRDFVWFVSVFAMSPEGRMFRYVKDTSGKSSRDLKKVRVVKGAKGISIKATINDVSDAVNEKEGSARSYESYCNDKLWRDTLKGYLSTQGMTLTFDYEPRTVVESTVHERLGLYKKGFRFTVTFGKKVDNLSLYGSISGSQYQSTSPPSDCHSQSQDSPTRSKGSGGSRGSRSSQ